MSNTAASNTGSNQMAVVLKQIEQYGFKFFGNGENNEPLVIAPNGQVIPLKVAYAFVQQQIKKAAEQSSGGSIESMPSMPQTIDSNPIGANFEKSPEKETSVEKKSESQNNIQKSNPAQVQTSTANPPAADTSIKMPQPYDEGFKVTKFDPTDPNAVSDYVQSNKSGSTTNSSTWLAHQFEKFLLEYKNKK